MSESCIERPLSELATITMGQSPESSCINTTERGLPFLQGCAEFGERVPIAKLHCFPPLRIAKSGSVLISVRAPVGTTNFADQDYCIGRGLGAVSAKQDMADNIFLLHAIEQNVGFLHRRSQGSTFLAIGSKELLALPVLSLPLGTQRHIAKILSTVDEAIEQTEALIAKYQQMKAGLMHDLFTRGVSPDGRLRPTYKQAPHLYKESPLGWIPKEWEVPTIGHCLIGIDAGNSPECPDTPASGDQWGVLKVGAVDPDGLRESENKTVIDERLKNPAFLICHNDLLLSRANTFDLVGLVCHVACKPHNLMLSDKTLRLHPVLSRTTTRFLFWTLQTPSSRRQIENLATGTSGSMKNISQSSVRAIRLARPEIEEQAYITARIDALADVMTLLRTDLGKFCLQKHGLMQDLQTGRVRVKVAEPASR